jgi:hypothetical protein
MRLRQPGERRAGTSNGEPTSLSAQKGRLKTFHWFTTVDEQLVGCTATTPIWRVRCCGWLAPDENFWGLVDHTGPKHRWGDQHGLAARGRMCRPRLPPLRRPNGTLTKRSTAHGHTRQRRASAHLRGFSGRPEAHPGLPRNLLRPPQGYALIATGALSSTLRRAPG